MVSVFNGEPSAEELDDIAENDSQFGYAALATMAPANETAASVTDDVTPGQE